MKLPTAIDRLLHPIETHAEARETLAKAVQLALAEQLKQQDKDKPK